jgi:hypothetical protein
MTSQRPSSSWLPQLLFWLTAAAALLLIMLVLVAPWLGGESRLVALFAHDATVRRTALGSAVGLLVTGCVFFRPPALARSAARKQTKTPPSQNVIGA